VSDRREVFDGLYRTDPDPWGYETSLYERDKYRTTLAALPNEHYLSTLEIGCSIAVLGELLALRSGRYMGVDVSPVAADVAARRLADVPGAEIVVGEVPEDWPDGRYDLIVLSEVLYFLSAPEIAELAKHVARDLVPGGDCVIVNWLGECDTDLDGDEAGQLFLDELRLHGLVQLKHDYLHPRYRLTVVRLG